MKRITRYPNGAIYQIVYHLDDDDMFWHREDGPAFEKFFLNGKLARQDWWFNNKKHKTDGPATIIYSKSEADRIERWYLNGRELTQEQIDKIKQDLAFKKTMRELLTV